MSARFAQNHDPVRLQHGQSNDGGDNTSQELAGGKAENTVSVTLSATSGAGSTRRGGKTRALGGRRGRGGAGKGGRARGTDWERAGAIDFLLNSGIELSAHSGTIEHGGEGQSRILRRRGILGAERLNSDEAENRVGKITSDLGLRRTRRRG